MSIEPLKLDWQAGRNRAQLRNRDRSQFAMTPLGRLRIYLRTLSSGASIWTAQLADGRRIATGHSVDECKQEAAFHAARLVADAVIGAGPTMTLSEMYAEDERLKVEINKLTTERYELSKRIVVAESKKERGEV